MPYCNDETSVISRYHPRNVIQSHEASGSYKYNIQEPKTKLKFTLGWELEANHIPVRRPAGVTQITDGSVNGDAAEFVVLPAVTRSPRYVLGLLKELVHAPKLNTDKSCGFHVHVSAQHLSVNKMRAWAIATEHLALQIEEKAFKAVPEARQSNTYCKRIQPLIPGFSFPANKYSNERRYHWLNTVEMFRPGGIRTIEVRLLGNTHRWKYLLAWTAFCMELAARGYAVSQRPFNSAAHVDLLGNMLDRIAIEIKPLEKRNDPIPEWVYTSLKSFGMSPNSWDRPLAKLSEMESEANNIPKKFYSDNQVTEETEERDDSCPCGCGDEGECDISVHDNGNCDRRECIYCHDAGLCGSLPDCVRCIRQAHCENRQCGVTYCSLCRERRRRAVTQQAILGCDATCNQRHNCPESNCLICGLSWGEHSGHDCRGGARGSFPLGGI